MDYVTITGRKETYVYEIQIHLAEHGLVYKKLCNIAFLTRKGVLQANQWFGKKTDITNRKRIDDIIWRIADSDELKNLAHLSCRKDSSIVILFVKDSEEMCKDLDCANISLWKPIPFKK